MNINYNYCCKKFMRYTQSSFDFNFSIPKGKFHWGELKYDELDMDTFYMEYCPFCGEKINVNNA